MKIFKIAVTWLIFAFSVFWFSGCSVVEPVGLGDKPSQASSEEYLTHIITRQGENLTTISMWYTGSGKNWQRIAEVNSLIDPRRIRIGDKILIPENLLITRETMPIDYLELIAENEVVVPQSPAPTPPPAEVELFGPIDTVTPAGSPGEGDSVLPLETIE